MGSTVNGIYVPDVGESGWGPNVSNNMRRLSELVINADAFAGNDSAKIQAAVTAAPSTGATVFMPGRTWNITTGITDAGKTIKFQGAGPRATVLQGSGITILSISAGGTGNNTGGSGVEDLQILGSPSNASTVGLEITNGANAAVRWNLRHIFVIGTATTGIGIRTIFGLEGVFDDVDVEQWSTGVSMQREGAGANRSNANLFSGCKIRANTIGIDIPAEGSADTFIHGCTIEGNSIGFQDASTEMMSITSTHLENSNGSQINITKSAGRLFSAGNYYTGAVANKDIIITGGATLHTSIGDTLQAGITHNGSSIFNIIAPVLGDPSVTGTGPIIRYGNDGFKALGTQLSPFVVNTVTRSTKATPTYSASITPDAPAGGWQTITVTNGTAFTINAPTNPPASTLFQELTIEIFNNSGGVMGAVTWNAAFKLVGGAFTNPANANKRFVAFKWNGTHWIEQSRAGADYV